MAEGDWRIRCPRCREQMERRDPAPGEPWKPDQFWVCPACGRHFWSTYPAPPAAPQAKPPATAGGAETQ